VGRRQTKSAADFYTAGGGITGFQNGLAIAGDYMSAASFLGISAAVMATGYDGLIYSIGFLVGWPIITFLMAERLRNLGKFTFADVAGYRFQQAPIRAFAASGTLVVVAFYLIAQMVVPASSSSCCSAWNTGWPWCIVGALMMVYVLFGGMTATTWVQIIKAGAAAGGRDLHGLHGAGAVRLQPRGAVCQGRAKCAPISPPTPAKHPKRRRQEAGLAIMGPGGFIKDPISAISFGMALMFGTAGLPHILMRFFTVPDAKEARKSVLWATTWIGYFYMLIFIIGFGAITLVLTNPEFADTAKGVIHGGAGTANMAAVLVAKSRGRQRVLRLHLGRGVRHHPGRGGRPDAVGRLGRVARPVCHRVQEGQGRQRLRAEGLAHHHLALGVIAVVLGIAFEKQNIAFMVSLAFAIAASANFPVLFMSVLWKDCTTKGAVIGGFLGLISSVALTIVSPSVWEATLGNPKGSALFPYTSPALFSMTIGFVGIWLFSITDKSANAAASAPPSRRSRCVRKPAWAPPGVGH
jgi:cation/acetate symporter